MDVLKLVIIEKEFKERIKWLIHLRWFAGIGVFMVITFSRIYITEGLPWISLYLGNMILIIYNGVSHLRYKYIESEKDIHIWFDKANRFANIQISLDWIILAYLIHFSGCVENPFIFFFIFHIVLASTLLSKRAVYLQTAGVVLLFAVICFGEYLMLIPHYPLRGIFPANFIFLSPWYTIGIFTVFAATMIFTCYMTTSIVDRLREGENELAVANKMLKEQDKLKSQYVLTVSHDLQGSLSSIQSCLKVVLSNLTGEISEKAREMIARAEQRTRSILCFVKDLLDLSRIRAEKPFEKKKTPLKPLVLKVIDQLKPRANAKKLTLKIEHFPNRNVKADPEALEHVFLNLIQNAIRYTPQSGEVCVRGHALQKNVFFQVSVSDTGIGISQEDLPHIFEDFYRAENAVIMEKSGTGLGLAIVKNIVEANGGDISVESQIGKGSQFIITLPITD